MNFAIPASPPGVRPRPGRALRTPTAQEGHDPWDVRATDARVKAGNEGRLFIAPPLRDSATISARVTVLEEAKGYALWERSDDESDEDVPYCERHDGMDLLIPDQVAHRHWPRGEHA